jgi:hypothetical protein
MSLEDWYKNGWLKKHAPAAPQIAQLLEVAQRDLRDAEVRGLSDAWRFGIAYNAAFQLAQADSGTDHIRTRFASEIDGSLFMVLLRSLCVSRWATCRG